VSSLLLKIEENEQLLGLKSAIPPHSDASFAATRRRQKLEEELEQSKSQREDLRNSLSGTTTEMLTKILSNPHLKLEKTIMCYEQQRVLPLTMEYLNSKIGTSAMELRLSLKLRIVPTSCLDQDSIQGLEWQEPLDEYEKFSSKQDQMESNIPISNDE